MKTCYFCTHNIKEIEYKDAEALKRFLDPYLKLVNHRRSGVCAGHQRKLATAVKRARFLALLPFISQ
jgi:small subunit ribosomal protein S18